MDIEDITCAMNEKFEELLEQEFTQVGHEKIRAVKSLDQRALPGRIWASDEALVVRTDSTRMLNYYGGFEYVDKSQVETFGDYTVYSAESGRVSSLLSELGFGDGECEDEEEEEDGECEV